MIVLVVATEAFQVENIYGYNKCIYTTSNLQISIFVNQYNRRCSNIMISKKKEFCRNIGC